jgi:hypothetical protein
MQDQPSSPGEDPQMPAGAHEEEAMVGRAVLALVLSLHPTTRLTIYELARELSKSPEDLTVERVVRDLVGAELLLLDGPYVMPTQAAMYLEKRGWIRSMTTEPPPPPKSTPNGG